MADLASAHRSAAAIDAIRRRSDAVFVELEGYPLVSAFGIACPRCAVVASAALIVMLQSAIMRMISSLKA